MDYKRDQGLGNQVHQYLQSLGVETPFTPGAEPNASLIEESFHKVMAEFGLDMTNDSLIDTPARLAKMYSYKELFSGLDYRNFPKSTVVANSMHFDEMVVERNIKVSSLCEHHLLPINGSAFVAYIPNEKVIGLSKMNRIVDFFCRRPQIQERLTVQIYHTLAFLLDTPDVAVLIQAEHLCVRHRGVEDPCSDTTTSKLGGKFLDHTVRSEYLQLCKGF